MTLATQTKESLQNFFLELKESKILYLSQSDLMKLGGNSSAVYVEGVEKSLKLHAQGEIVQPLKPYLRWGEKKHIADRIIAMPCYLGGTNPIAGLKWVGSKHDNPSSRGLNRASAVIILNDPQSHFPMAILEGSLISGMRTAAVTAIACRYLAKDNFANVTCIGCGPIAQMQLITILEQFNSISSVNLFDLKLSAAQDLVTKLRQSFPDVNYQIATSASSAISQGEVVITCTVTDKPYIHYEWLQKGTFISNVSIMDLHKEVFLKADKVVVDDWVQSNREKKVINQLVLEGRFSREQVHAELGEVIVGSRSGRDSNSEIIVLNPMGMAIEDIACAQIFYEKALAAKIGTYLSLN